MTSLTYLSTFLFAWGMTKPTLREAEGENDIRDEAGKETMKNPQKGCQVDPPMPTCHSASSPCTRSTGSTSAPN